MSDLDYCDVTRIQCGVVASPIWGKRLTTGVNLEDTALVQGKFSSS